MNARIDAGQLWVNVIIRGLAKSKKIPFQAFQW